ncbi:MAG TPA: bifunctional oligoribonuclease/PAP phosphatase NrnA [Candidatus Limnocylindrales bacterium]|nr:bifunctional oligoribonuclease/PAP phosphatase NrnA [Candidatus Limnocylindrales bacterium]
MQYLAICEDDLLFQFMRNVATEQGEVRYLVPDAKIARRIRRQGGKVRHGDLNKEETYKKITLHHVDQAVVFVRDTDDQKAVCRLLRQLDKNLSIVSLTSDKNGKIDVKAPEDPLLRHLQLADIFKEFCAVQLLDTLNIKKVERVRSLFADGEKIHILLQHDPDPDAIGSALALRELLGRNRATTPIVTFGEVTRPENLAMISLLEIQIERITPGDLHKDGARLALVDVQPPYFEQSLGRVDLVVDHHPKRSSFKSRFADLRTGYGSTATIFTEYLRAAGMEPSQRLATALLYGIKTDTLFLERGNSLADLSAFNYLYPLANKAMITRIERPALPREDLEAMGRALSRLQVESGVAVIHLGEVNREDVIPQMAEFCLQIEGVDWGVVSGLVNDRVVISVRNVGYVKSAGDIMKKLYDDIGSAGGHRAMAKAVVPLERFKERFGEVSEKSIRDAMLPMIVDRDQIELELR